MEVLKLAVRAELPAPTSTRAENPTAEVNNPSTTDIKNMSTATANDLLRNNSCETAADVEESCDNKSVSSTEYENS